MTVFLTIVIVILAAAVLAAWVTAYKCGYHRARWITGLRYEAKIETLEAAVRAYRIGARQPQRALVPARRPSFTPAVQLHPSATGTFRKLTDTGEIRAIRDRGDTMVARIEAGA